MTEVTLWSGEEIPRLGLGTWAIGGPFWSGDQPLGWGVVDDGESLQAISRAVELGIRLFDTADVYGCGHAEELLGQALQGEEDVLISTKFGNRFDVATKQLVGPGDAEDHIRAAIEASLKRLRRDRIDLVFFHLNEHPLERAEAVFATLAELRRQGKVAAFGWSTDFPENASKFGDMEGFVSVQHDMNLFRPARELIDVAGQHDLVCLARQPLAMGLLSGRFRAGEGGFDPSDIRARGPDWQKFFVDGRPNQQMLAKVEAVRELLSSGGRSVVQGALAWIWATSARVVPIPGFRTVQQVEENAAALRFGPLPAETVAEIDRIMEA